MSAKDELQAWCHERGLEIDIEQIKIGPKNECRVRLKSHKLLKAVGQAPSKKKAEAIACQNLLVLLETEEQFQIPQDDTAKRASNMGILAAKRALETWCLKRQLELECQKIKLVDRQYKCIVKVGSIDVFGVGLGSKSKSSVERACKDFLSRLKIRDNNLQESVNLQNKSSSIEGSADGSHINDVKTELDKDLQNNHLQENVDLQNKSSSFGGSGDGSHIDRKTELDMNLPDSNSESDQEQNHEVVERAQTPTSWQDILEVRDSDKNILVPQDCPSPETDGKDVKTQIVKDSPWQSSNVLIAKLKQEVEKNRGKLDCRPRNVKAFLSDWCRLNNIALIYDYRPSEILEKEVVCKFTLRSASIGTVFSTEASADMKYRADNLAVRKALRYLLEAELVTYDEIKVNLNASERKLIPDKPKNVKKPKSGAVRKRVLKNSNMNFFDEVINLDAKSKLEAWCTKNGLNLQICYQLTAPSPWNVEVESFDFVATGETRADACKNFIDHLKKEYKFEVQHNNNMCNGLREWCVEHGLIMTFSRQNAELLHECKIKVDTVDFTGIGIAADKLKAESLACQDFIQRLKSANISQESNVKPESNTKSVALEKPLESILKTFGKLSLEEPLESTRKPFGKPSLEEPLESIRCEGRDTNTGTINEQNTHLKADKKGVLPKSSSQSVSLQNSTVSVAESEQVNGSNEGRLECRKSNPTTFLDDWCHMNNFSPKYDHQTIQYLDVVLCSLTLTSTLTGTSFSTEAAGNIRKRSRKLAAIQAIIYLLKKELLTSEEIEGLSLEVSKKEQTVHENVRNFLTDKTYADIKSSLGVNLLQKLRMSADSFPANETKTEKRNIERVRTFLYDIKNQEKNSSLRLDLSRKLEVDGFPKNEAAVGLSKPKNMNNLGKTCRKSKTRTCRKSNPMVFLDDWCEMNNLSLTYYLPHIQGNGFELRICAFTLKSPSDDGTLFATVTPGISRMSAKLLAAKEAISYLLEKELVTSKEIGKLSLDKDKQEMYAVERVQTFLFDKKNEEERAKLGDDVILMLKMSVNFDCPEVKRSIFLKNWCRMNNISVTYENHSIRLDGFQVELCTLVVESSSKGPFSSMWVYFLAPGISQEKARDLVTKEAITYMFWKEMVTYEEIKEIVLAANREEIEIVERVRVFLSDKTCVQKSSLSADLIEKLKYSVNSFSKYEKCEIGKTDQNKNRSENVVKSRNLTFSPQEASKDSSSEDSESSIVFRNEENVDVSPSKAKLSPQFSSSNLANQKTLEIVKEPLEKPVREAPSKKKKKETPKWDLEKWCLKNGLRVQFLNKLLKNTEYHYNLSMKPYHHNGTGNDTNQIVARNLACESFISRLPETDKSEVLAKKNTRISAAFHEWCLEKCLKPMFDLKKTARIMECVVKVESFDFVGTCIGVENKSLQNAAALDFLNRLKAAGKYQDPDTAIYGGPSLSHQKSEKIAAAVNDGSGSDLEILDEKLVHNTSLMHTNAINDTQEIVLSSEISNLLKRVELPVQESDTGFNQFVPFGTAKNRLQRFFDENCINAQYTYSTDSQEKRHVASMKVYMRRIGRSFSVSEYATTQTEATEKCACSLLNQLYHANLLDIGTKRQRNQCNPINKPIEVNVPDTLIENIRQLCPEFGVDTPDSLIPTNHETGPVLMFQDFTIYDESDAKEYNLQVKYNGARMNWNPWGEREILRNQRFFNMDLSKISSTLKSSYTANSQRHSFKERLRERQKLPIFQHKNKILKLINDHPVSILKGSTGSGKSTQVCQYILDSAIEKNKGAHCNIIVIEPKRICASSLAERVASERNEQMGQTVGYCVRFDKNFPRSHGSILFCTPGSFLRRAENGLRGISHIILDEIHERSAEADYILIILRRMLKMFDTLKVILMSADVDINLFASYFGGCAHMTVHGNCYPVKDYFLEDIIEITNFKFKDSLYETRLAKENYKKLLAGSSTNNLNCRVVDSSAYSQDTLKTLAIFDEQAICPELIEAIILWIRENKIQGSILVFLPGWAEIRQVSIYLRKSEKNANYCVLPLHSKIKNTEQRLVFKPPPSGKTKIILSTSLAESSVTIDDVVCVIDSCKARISISQDNLSFKFVSEWASKVNLNQRLGRAGRLKPGYCFRLCSKARYEELPPDIEPQIFRVPLYNLVLSMKLLRLGNIREVFKSALDPPPFRAVENAERLLIELGCLDNRKRLTPLGHTLARLPLDPRLGRMLLMSTLFGCPLQGLKLAAYASTQEEMLDNPTESMEKVGNERFSDHMAVLHALSSKETLGHVQESYELSALNLFEEINKIEEQLYSILYRLGFDLTSSLNCGKETLDLVTGLLCHAFYPNVCAITQPENKGGNISKGRGARVSLPSCRYSIHSKLSLIIDQKKEDLNFNPPSNIFVFGEQTETSVNVLRNITMVSPLHLLCFTNCKVVYENGVVKIDNWLPLKMDLTAAAAVMCMRKMIEKALHEIVSDPSGVDMTNYKGLSTVVKQLCKTDFGQAAVDNPVCSNSELTKISKNLSNLSLEDSKKILSKP